MRLNEMQYRSRCLVCDRLKATVSKEATDHVSLSIALLTLSPFHCHSLICTIDQRTRAFVYKHRRRNCTCANWRWVKAAAASVSMCCAVSSTLCSDISFQVCCASWSIVTGCPVILQTVRASSKRGIAWRLALEASRAYCVRTVQFTPPLQWAELEKLENDVYNVRNWNS